MVLYRRRARFERRGSVFCRCLASRFLGEIRHIAEREPPPEGLVIEASGVADPPVVHRMVSETRLDERYGLRCVVAVVDPGRFLKLVHTLPTTRAQVEASDLVLINKHGPPLRGDPPRHRGGGPADAPRPPLRDAGPRATATTVDLSARGRRPAAP